MKLWEILLLIAAITVAMIVIVLVVTACVIAGRESRKEDKDNGEIRRH